MGNDITVIRAWVRSANETAKASGKKLQAVLTEIGTGIMSSGVQSGQIVIATSEGGGSVSFTLPPGHTPLELASLNEEAISFCYQFADPNTPNLNARRITRLRASFWRAKPA
jgi:hypothetical protein